MLDKLNGYKTTIGAILQTLIDVGAALATFFPQLQAELVALGTPEAYAANVFVWVAKGFLYVGLAHKFYKNFFGLPTA